MWVTNLCLWNGHSWWEKAHSLAGFAVAVVTLANEVNKLIENISYLWVPTRIISHSDYFNQTRCAISIVFIYLFIYLLFCL